MDSSHATSRATMQLIASMLHSSAYSSSSNSECTGADFVAPKTSIASAFAILPRRLEVDEAAELTSVGRVSNSDSDSRTGRALRSVLARPLLLAVPSCLRNWAVASFEDRGELLTVVGESHAGMPLPEVTKATAVCRREADEKRAMQPAATCVLRLISWQSLLSSHCVWIRNCLSDSIRGSSTAYDYDTRLPRLLAQGLAQATGNTHVPRPLLIVTVMRNIRQSLNK